MKRLPAFERLITLLSRLPGIGKRSAERMALALTQDRSGLVRQLAEALQAADAELTACSACGCLTERDQNPCALCADEQRAGGVLCVVETPGDIFRMEDAGAFHGRYHALMGRLSPARGTGVAQLRINELLARIQPESVTEVVVALGTDAESDATAAYLHDLLTSRGVKVTRLAYGLPAGSAIEYADPATLARALNGRFEME
jgi:recombination protein RecR